MGADDFDSVRESRIPVPDGVGVNAVPGADLAQRNLTMAYLRFADLTNANLQGATLTNAELLLAWLKNADMNGADVRGANFGSTTSRY